jgi:raffinose/stachyose/melibiose transport system substrate-binding protein
MRKSLLAIGALTLLLTLSAICASAASGRTQAVTLRVLMPTTGQPPLDLLIKNFERVYPNIQVEAQYLPSPDLPGYLATQLQAGTAADLIYVQSGNAGINGVWPLADAGRLLNLTGSPWQGRIYAPAKSFMMRKGKVYAWPLNVLPFEIFVNDDQFKQLGLKAPTTFSQLLGLCKRITDAGKVPFVQGWGNASSGLIFGRVLYSHFVYNIDPNWDAKRAKKQVSFASSPLWRRALQAVVDMKNANCFQPGSSGTSRPQQYALFAGGTGVMTVTAATDLPNMLAINPNMHISMIPFPGDSAKNATVSAIVNVNIGVNAATKYPKEARTFINFLAREQQSSLYGRVSGGISVLDAKKGLLPTYMKPLTALFKAGKVVSSHDATWPNSQAYNDALANGMLGLITGQTSIDTILANMDRYWDNP